MYNIGYTSGVFDLFHIGHLNLLKAAKKLCSTLIVGVTTDKIAKYKHKTPIIPFDQRIEIVKSIKYVDKVISQIDLDKVKTYDKLLYDVLIVGDDWKNTPTWNDYEKRLKVPIIYLPYTTGVSSTLIISQIKNNE